MLETADLIDEKFYLGHYKDVADAVTRGLFTNGTDHYLKFGKLENRMPSGFFDPNFYLARYSDVAIAVSNGIFQTAFDHFIINGQREGRDPNPVVDTRYYLDNNPDVRAAVAQTDPVTGMPFTAAEHLLKYGKFDGRDPSRIFNTRFYLDNNPDVSSGLNNRSVSSALKHYLDNGLEEGRIGSAAGLKNSVISTTETPGREIYNVAGDVYTFLVTGEETDGGLALFNFFVPPGFGPPPHIHAPEDESFYALDGTPTFFQGNQTVIATPGTYAYLPRLRPHGFSNGTDAPVQVLSISLPGTLDDYFRLAGKPVVNLQQEKYNPTPPTAEDIARLGIVGAMFGGSFFTPGSPVPPGKEYVLEQPAGGNRPTYSAGVGTYTSLTTREESEGTGDISTLLLAPGTGLSRLTVSHEGQAYYVIDGTLTVQIGDRIQNAAPRTAIYIPPGKPFAINNSTAAPTRVLSIATPMGNGKPSMMSMVTNPSMMSMI